jgi:hypothetical protein
MATTTDTGIGGYTAPRYRVHCAEWDMPGCWTVYLDEKPLDTYESVRLAQAYADYMNARMQCAR